MAKSSALTSALAAALLAGTFGLAHAQGGGGGGAGGGAGAAGSASGATGQTGGTGGTGGTTGSTNPAVGGTNPNSAANQPGTNLNNSGVGRAGATGANTTVGGGHRQPRKDDLPRNRRQGNMPDKKQKDIDSRIGSICRGC